MTTKPSLSRQRVKEPEQELKNLDVCRQTSSDYKAIRSNAFFTDKVRSGSKVCVYFIFAFQNMCISPESTYNVDSFREPENILVVQIRYNGSNVEKRIWFILNVEKEYVLAKLSKR